jgi:hypothetical protein
MAPSMQLLSIPDDVLQHTMLFCSVKDTCTLECSCSYMKMFIETKNQWKECCDRDFKHLSRYNCQQHGYPDASYKVSYRFIFLESRRTIITVEDLESLDWNFRFTPAAGVGGNEMLNKCKFSNRLLQTLLIDPPLPYFASKNGSLVVVGIASFSAKDVCRLPDGEWLIECDTIAFQSCGPARCRTVRAGANLKYKELA